MLEQFFKQLKELGVESLAELERLCKEERQELQVLSAKKCDRTSVNELVDRYYRQWQYDNNI